jgi:glycosyltransferase involved in cell wall biosynthesis
MCRALEEQGTEVVIACTDHGVAKQEQQRGQVYREVKTVFFPAQWGDSFKYSRPLRRWLNDNVSSFDVVHIHAVFNHACFAAARACVKQRVPYVVRPLGTLSPWGMNQKPLRKTLFWRLAGRQMLSRAAAVHYTAMAEKIATEELLGLNHGCVIPLAVTADSDGTAWGGEVTDFAPYILVLSRLHPKKGLDVFLDAFLSLVQQSEFAHWRLVLAGEGPEDYVKLLRDKVKTRHCEQTVTFTGWLEGEKKNTYLRNAALLSLPSYDENFGLCVLEAMACGVPVLVSRHVNLAEDIQSVQAGWITEVDQYSLEKALAEALRSPEERSRRGNSGKQLARRFTWPNVAAQLNELYAQVTFTH